MTLRRQPEVPVDRNAPPPKWLAEWTRRFRYPQNIDPPEHVDIGEERAHAKALRFWSKCSEQSKAAAWRREP